MSTTSYTRPLPTPTAVSKPFWDGCSEGRLLFQRASDSSAVFPPQSYAPGDLGPLTWAESAGIGTVYSFTVVYRPQTPAFDAPYVVAIVELDEGYTMLTNLTACDPDEVKVGMQVRVRFERQNEEITLPFFEPV